MNRVAEGLRGQCSQSGEVFIWFWFEMSLVLVFVSGLVFELGFGLNLVFILNLGLKNNLKR